MHLMTTATNFIYLPLFLLLKYTYTIITQRVQYFWFSRDKKGVQQISILSILNSRHFLSLSLSFTNNNNNNSSNP